MHTRDVTFDCIPLCHHENLALVTRHQARETILWSDKMSATMHSNADISPGGELYTSQDNLICSLVLPQLYSGTKIVWNVVKVANLEVIFIFLLSLLSSLPPFFTTIVCVCVCSVCEWQITSNNNQWLGPIVWVNAITKCGTLPMRF